MYALHNYTVTVASATGVLVSQHDYACVCRRRMRIDHNEGNFSLSDWSRKFDNSLVDDEMHLQRRRHFPLAVKAIQSSISMFSEHKLDAATQCA